MKVHCDVVDEEQGLVRDVLERRALLSESEIAGRCSRFLTRSTR